MCILVLNGSTKKMAEAFRAGSVSAGHTVDMIDMCKMRIARDH